MRPLIYRTCDCKEGARIGGTVPKGLEDEIKDDHSQYFGTFPLPQFNELEFSLFHRFDVDGADNDRDIISFNNRILEPSELIWACVHRISVRGEVANHHFEARGIEIGPESADEFIDENGRRTPYPGSKLGGRSSLDRYWLQKEVDRLETNGYVHLLQIGMHRSDLIEGFPWDPGFLHVRVLNPNEPKTFRFMIEQ